LINLSAIPELAQALFPLLDALARASGNPLNVMLHAPCYFAPNALTSLSLRSLRLCVRYAFSLPCALRLLIYIFMYVPYSHKMGVLRAKKCLIPESFAIISIAC